MDEVIRTVEYSICMVNYNMADTLERSVSSIAGQLDDRFEIVLVDDGSSDSSVQMMRRLAERFPMIRVISLRRDSRRRLGDTRNVSVREARGKYCLLHLDCDDVYAPHLLAWIEAFHQVEAAIGHRILLGGRQIHMARRDVLLAEGPYINIFRGEDRDMCVRFSRDERLWFMRHASLTTRLPKRRRERVYRAVFHTVDHMITEFRNGMPLGQHLRLEIQKAKGRSLALILFRLCMIPATWLISRFHVPIEHEASVGGYEEYARYRAAHTGTLAELLSRHGRVPDWSCLSAAARPYFDIEPESVSRPPETQ